MNWLSIGKVAIICRKYDAAYSWDSDSYRTPICLEYPAHSIAAGCIYLASMLLKLEDSSFIGLSDDQPWDQLFCSRMEDMEGNNETQMSVAALLSHADQTTRCVPTASGLLYCARQC